MKPSPRSPRAPSTSRPKPPDGPSMPRFGGALLVSAESRKSLTQTSSPRKRHFVRNAMILHLALAVSSHAEFAVAAN